VKGFKVPIDKNQNTSSTWLDALSDSFLTEHIFEPTLNNKRVLTWSSSDLDHKFDTLKLLSYDLDYEEFANITLENLTETLRADIDHIDGYFVVYEDDRTTEVFKPLQFHFHSRSEYTFDGKHYNLELHIYHISIDKKHKSVLAVYFDVAMGGNQQN
jgi:carbonic anhydrase